MPDRSAEDAGRRPRLGDGLLLVDKPSGWTSHDVVGRCRRLCGTRRVGHAGTLDPMATGVLVLGVNRATKLLTFLVGADKRYTATIRLGQGTVTDDAEGAVTDRVDTTGLTDEAVAREVTALTGPIQQVPSAVSAIKVDGKRSYARVRSGEDVTLQPRPVTVHEFLLRDRRDGRERTPAGLTAYCDLDVEVEVSSGTYVRALARDLGRALGVGGHLTALRRTRVGGFDLAATRTLETLQQEGAEAHLVPLAEAAAAALPSRTVTEPEARALGYGQQVRSAAPGRTGPVAALSPDGTLVAVLDESAERTRSLVVFAAR